jgi:hypothetical protein
MSLVLLRIMSLTGISQKAARLSMKMGTGSYLRRSILLKMFRPLSRETSFSEERPPMIIPTLNFWVFSSPLSPISEAHRQRHIRSGKFRIQIKVVPVEMHPDDLVAGMDVEEGKRGQGEIG